MDRVNRQGENQVTSRSDAEVMMLTQKELAEIVTAAVNAALKAREEARPVAPQPMSPEEAKARIRAAVDSIGRTAVDCLKIAGGGLLGALDELFTAGLKVGLRATGRMR
ncbi:MAG TPA: hypothetical protein GX506_03285 [Firmicutes bacterium]|nr:hypothetical protein [Bacillota bacterium]